MDSTAAGKGQPTAKGSAAASYNGCGNSNSSCCGGSTSLSSDLVVPVTIVSSVGEFQAVFSHTHCATGDKSDAFLLCYEQPADAVTADGLLNFQTRVVEAARLHHTRLRLFLWNCTSSAFASAKAQLDKQPGSPLLLIVFRGAIADTIRNTSLADITTTEVPKLCSRLASFQTSAKPARVTGGPSQDIAAAVDAGDGASDSEASSSLPPKQHLSVDVAKIVGMGKRLMSERNPFYAEKFFAKALQSLDAVSNDVDSFVASRDDYDGSVALCLAWVGLAQLVQQKHIVDNPYLVRLCQTEHLRSFREEPLSETCRAVVTWDLMQAAPRTWNEATCSEKALRAVLQENPQDAAERSMLVLTLFLSGDVERALTEALKLHVCGHAYGRLALKQIAAFLGSGHALVKQLGIPALLDLRYA